MTGNLIPGRLRASHVPSHRNPKSRRNGKLQACEPCRKGKLRCDHMMPSCGRCSRRKKQDQCVYHPAPLTKANFAIPTGNSNQSSPELDDFASPYYASVDLHTSQIPSYSVLRRPRQPQPSTPLPQTTSTYSASTPRSDDQSRSSDLPSSYLQVQHATHSSARTDDIDNASTRYPDNNGALGHDGKFAFVSHYSVIAENELSIGIEDPGISTTLMSKLDPSQVERGAAVLTLLQDLPTIQRYIDKWFSFAGGVIAIEPMVKVYLDGICSTWQKALSSQKPAKLRAMSQKVWENTFVPAERLLHKQTIASEFCMAVTGEHLRWEIVGIIVSLISLLAQSLKDGDPIFCSYDKAPVDRSALALKTCNASEMCVGFCNDFNITNDMYLWLLYENSIAYTSLRTRGGLDSAKKTSDLATALLNCNLHQQIQVDEHTPFFIAELRKRLFICAYAKDKQFATFTGRPPKLVRQYCRLNIPLDLTDAQLMAMDLRVETVIDEEGWNQHGIAQRCSMARLSAENALIMEEILELSLGQLPEDVVVQRAMNIEAKVNQCWNDLPGFLRIDPNDPWTARRTPLELFFLASIRLTYLHHQFLLQQTLSKKCPNYSSSPSNKLLATCDETFRFVVSMVKNKDLFRDFQVDFTSILTAHGLPSASLIALELLPLHIRPATTSTTYPLHRSTTIQNLSVYISALETVDPASSGYSSCARGHRFLSRILDIILDPSAGISSGSSLSVLAEKFKDTEPTAGEIDPMLGDPGDADFARWLEGMEWDIEGNGLVNFS